VNVLFTRLSINSSIEAMQTEWISWIAIGVLIIWIAVLTMMLLKQRRMLSMVFSDAEDPGVKQRFMQLLKEMDEVNGRQEFLAKNMKQLALENLKNVSKVMMLRYNPYGDVGGEQSFSIVLLNGVDSGMVLTSLHSRAGTRSYVKAIAKGKAEMQLSKEEQEVLDEAVKTGT